MKIAIAGCGPAGLTTALVLDRLGHQVTLLERFESPRPLGSGIILQPTGLAVLHELGLASQIEALGKQIHRMRGVVIPRGKTVLDVNYQALGAGAHGLAVHRAALFDVLYAAVNQQDIGIRVNVEVGELGASAKSVIVMDSTGESHGQFDLVVDASGAGSGLRPYAVVPVRRRELTYGAIWGSFDWPAEGFDEQLLDQRYVGAHTMIGVLPIGKHSAQPKNQAAFFWSLKTRSYQDWLDQGLDAWKQEVHAIWPDTSVILDQIIDPAQMTLARYGHCTLRRPYGDRIVYVGDSAHSTSPQLGQGANMALLDAWALGAALQSTNDVAAALRLYADSRCWHVRAFQLVSLALTPFYQSDSRLLAALRDGFFDPFSRLPLARRLVAGLIAGTLGNPFEKIKLPRKW